MKTLKDFDFKNKKVLLRCDFNVPLSEKGEIRDDFRIKKTIPTISHLQEKGAKIILMSHLGRPQKDIKNLEKYTLKPVALKLEKLLGVKVKFLVNYRSKEAKKEIEKIKEGEIFLLENLRFNKEEEENDAQFAQELASLGDIYINDAFGASHRAHASVSEITKHLSSGAGFLLEKEVQSLLKATEKSSSPLVVIIGGIKIDTKIKLIERFSQGHDHLLLGGKIAYEILTARGLCPGGPLPEKEMFQKIEKIDLTNPKIHFPVDGALCLKNLEEGYFREASLGQLRKEEDIFDIGPETIKLFSKIIKEAKTVIWNGPLGYFEDERFAEGSLAIANAILESKAFSVAGGGETVSFLTQYNLREKFDFISTGGGAMLEFLSGDKLPGIEALN